MQRKIALQDRLIRKFKQFCNNVLEDGFNFVTFDLEKRAVVSNRKSLDTHSLLQTPLINCSEAFSNQNSDF